jgi:bifunctional DNase/RNase
MIPVEVINVAIVDKRFIILLKGEADERVLPIFVDEHQAQSILVQINHVEVQRPLTHDLFKTVLDQLGFRITRVEITDVKDDIFFSRLNIEGNGSSLAFDARPSDALCMALRFGATIHVEEHVMEKAGVVISKKDTEEAGELAQLNESENEMSALDVLNFKLKKAIKEERYEEAAQLRDEINQLMTSN